jgi:hypothetical protein
MRNPTVTHAFGMDQREVIMTFTAGNGTLTVTAPPNGNIAPPGYYMLFLLNNSGVPSVATFIQITNGGSSKSTVMTMPSSAIVAQSITSNPARKQVQASNVTTSDAATKTQSVRPIENPEAKTEASRKTAAQIRGTWTGTFASKHQKVNPFSLTVVINPDSHGHLIATSTLNSDCLTSSQLQLQVSITGSKIVLAGSDESGDNITVRGTLDKKGGTMESTYILDGSATGRCETDDGVGTLEKR